MQDMIVLGLIPGTNFQINFIVWLAVVGLLGLFVTRTYVVRQRQIRQRIQDLTKHRPLPAKAFHSRLQ